ncbi:Nucleolar Complex 2 protein [Puttea exsequens]|nr:Nucleolar Complex 2 protein [Puttea exsequens]
MPGRAKKSTKKFEKNHLKDTIDKRKEFAKIKQRQQIKVKKQKRNAADKSRAVDDGEGETTPRSKNKANGTAVSSDLSKMSVDDFFQGGFQLPEQKKQLKSSSGSKSVEAKLGKRKRDTEADGEIEEGKSDSSVPDEDMAAAVNKEAESSQEEEFEDHQGDLDALAEKDPEFYKYLKENDAELLDFDQGADLAEVDQLSEDDDLAKKKRKKTKTDKHGSDDEAEDGSSDVTMEMVNEWRTAMSEQYSLGALRQVVLAFRAAVYINKQDGKEHKYSISSPEVYHHLLMIALKHVPTVLNHHLPAKESISGKVRIATDSKKFRTLAPLLKSYTASIHHLMENISDPSVLKLTLSSLLPLIPYLLSFKKALKTLVKMTVNIWSDTSTSEATRITAFLVIRRLAFISDASLREAVLKTTYQGLIKGSRITNVHTLPGINLMKNSAAELWNIDPSIGYTTGFTYIRQLAVHLRKSITHPTKDSYKELYNWQYTHSLDFWSRVLSNHCSPTTNPTLKTPSASPLHPLIYPLVQITLGALRLIPTPAYFPLRFHLTRSLLRLSRTTITYIPLAPALLEVLASPECSKPPKPSTLAPLDFATALRAPKAYLRTRVYQDGLGQQVQELLAEFFACWAKSIAFPELTIPPTVTLKRWLKSASASSTSFHNSKTSKTATTSKPTGQSTTGNRNGKLNASISLLLQKLAAQAEFVEKRRAAVRFGPGDREGVEGFLREVGFEEMPLGAYVEGVRRGREERERIVGEGRREERASEGRRDEMGTRGKGKGGGRVGLEDDMEVDRDGEDES